MGKVEAKFSNDDVVEQSYYGYESKHAWRRWKKVVPDFGAMNLYKWVEEMENRT
jgi:hypothetical protein